MLDLALPFGENSYNKVMDSRNGFLQTIVVL